MDNKEYLGKIAKLKKIDGLAALFRHFLKSELHVSQEMTFQELEDKIQRRHSDIAFKEQIHSLCEHFSRLEYRKSRPSRDELSNIKKQFKKVVQASMPNTNGPLDTLKAPISQGRQTIEKMLVGLKLINPKPDKELESIRRYVKVSLDSGAKKENIIAELSDLGFKKKDILEAIKNVKKGLTWQKKEQI